MNRRTMSAQKRAELMFPIRLKVVVPRTGLGRQSVEIDAWLDANLGRDDWGKSGTQALGTDATAIHFRSADDLVAFLAAFPDLDLPGGR